MGTCVHDMAALCQQTAVLSSICRSAVGGAKLLKVKSTMIHLQVHFSNDIVDQVELAHRPQDSNSRSSVSLADLSGSLVHSSFLLPLEPLHYLTRLQSHCGRPIRRDWRRVSVLFFRVFVAN